MNNNERSGVIITALFFIGLVSVLSYTCNSCSSSTVNEHINPNITNSEYDGSVPCVEDYIKEHLNDPSSYESVEWTKVVKLDTSFARLYSGAQYATVAKYRAKNGFGALVLQKTMFYFTDYGKVVYAQNDNP